MAAVALLIGLVPGAGAQANDLPLPQQQASLPAPDAAVNAPVLPLGHDDTVEVQNQLIALGFDPGPADGQVGPATIAAARQYDQSRGGSGSVSIDGALLARLKQDTGPRLTYEQVAERSRGRHQARTSAPAPEPPASNQVGNIVQQIAPVLGAMIRNSNDNSGYGQGYYGPGPRYYGPGPGYYDYYDRRYGYAW
jgi:peptidoglycan hydrolase-like protein with peptidoglycan-binding domain